MNKKDEVVEIEITEEKFYRIEEIAKKAEISQSSLRYYLRIGLITPAKEDKGYYLLKESTLYRIKKIQRLKKDLGVNLSGVSIILDLLERIEDMERQLSQLKLQI